MPQRRLPSLPRSLRAAALVLFSLLVLANPGCGAPVSELQPFAASASQLRAALRDLEPQAGWEIDTLVFETSFAVDAQGRFTERRHRIFRVLGPGAIDGWATLVCAWSPWFQARPEIRARVIDPEGGEHRLDLSTIAEAPVGEGSGLMFADSRELRAPLPAFAVGAVVETEVVLRDEQPLFSAGSLREVALIDDHYRLARVVLDEPAGFGLIHRLRRLPTVEPRVEVRGGRQLTTFEYRDLAPGYLAEADLPPEVPWYSTFQVSSGRSWEEVARLYSEIVDRAIAGSTVDDWVKRALRGSPPSAAVIDRLLAELQATVRYAGVELGEGRLVPRSPRETLARRYGDCKDKATLLVALLRAAEVPAYVALLRAGVDTDVVEDLPGLGAFDHAVVYVPASPPIWIDPTEPLLRAGELPERDRGRLALVAAPGIRGLVRTPEARPGDNLLHRQRDVWLAPLGRGRIVEAAEYHGDAEVEARQLFAGPEVEDRGYWARDYADRHLASSEVERFETSPVTDLGQPFHTRLEVAGSEQVETGLEAAEVAIDPAGLLERLPVSLRLPPADGAARTAELRVSSPYVSEWTYRIHPPPGFSLRDPPEPRQESVGSGRLSRSFRRLEDGGLEAVLRFESGPVRLSPAAVQAYPAAVRALVEAEPLRIRFVQVGAEKLAQGDILGALAEFRRLAAADPTNGLYVLQLSRTLLAGGMGDLARVAARRAVALGPGLAAAHANLGWVLQHDEVGRLRGPGFDRAGAVAAYREALRLDPADLAVRADLAILLEHDAAGVAYGPGSDLEAAARLYCEIDRAGVKTYDDNWMANLKRRGRYAELQEAAEKLADAGARREQQVVASAALAGPEAAARLASSAPSVEERARLLATAGQTLMASRRYAEAAQMLRQAGALAPKAAGMLALADRIGRVVPWDEMQGEEANPTAFVRSLFRRLVQGELTADGLEPYLSRRLFPEELDIEELRGEPSALRASLAKQAAEGGFSPEMLLDVGLSVLGNDAEGDDELGYRLRLDFDGGATDGASAFVVQEDGEYRLLSTGSSWAPVARLGQGLLTQGRLDLARRWLDWAADELGEQGDPDPMARRPFSLLWQRGGDEAAARLALAVLPVAESAAASRPSRDQAARQRAAREALAAIAPLRGTASGDVAVALDLAQAQAFTWLDRAAELVAVRERLALAAPDSLSAFRDLFFAYRHAGRPDDARRLGEARLERRPDDETARFLLGELAMREGDAGEVVRLLAPLERRGRALPRDLNRLAWAQLFLPDLGEAALAQAQRASELTSHGDRNILHTLATVYADLGRPAEAYKVILESLRAGRNEGAGGFATLGPDDWYVFGRLAESYGLPDEARTYYQQVLDGGTPQGLDTRLLASRRLAALGPPGAARRSRQ